MFRFPFRRSQICCIGTQRKHSDSQPRNYLWTNISRYQQVPVVVIRQISEKWHSFSESTRKMYWLFGNSFNAGSSFPLCSHEFWVSNFCCLYITGNASFIYNSINSNSSHLFYPFIGINICIAWKSFWPPLLHDAKRSITLFETILPQNLSHKENWEFFWMTHLFFQKQSLTIFSCSNSNKVRLSIRVVSLNPQINIKISSTFFWLGWEKGPKLRKEIQDFRLLVI